MCWEMGIEADPKLNKYEQAASSYRKAADHGNADAQYCLACYQRFGLGGIDKRNTGKKDEGLSQLLSTSIDEFGLSTRACNCLESESITTIGELIRLNEDDLLEIRNFGKTTLDELREKLAAKGLRLDRQPNWLKKAAVGGQPDAQFEFGLQLLDTVKERTQSGADAECFTPWKDKVRSWSVRPLWRAILRLDCGAFESGIIGKGWARTSRLPKLGNSWSHGNFPKNGSKRRPRPGVLRRGFFSASALKREP